MVRYEMIQISTHSVPLTCGYTICRHEATPENTPILQLLIAGLLVRVQSGEPLDQGKRQPPLHMTPRIGHRLVTAVGAESAGLERLGTRAAARSAASHPAAPPVKWA